MGLSRPLCSFATKVWKFCDTVPITEERLSEVSKRLVQGNADRITRIDGNALCAPHSFDGSCGAGMPPCSNT